MKRLRIYFEDLNQDLLSFEITIEHENSSMGKIVAANFPVLTDVYGGKFVDMETVKIGEKLGILNFKLQCTEFIKYKIENIEEIETTE